jgi:hypothetical protein
VKNIGKGKGEALLFKRGCNDIRDNIAIIAHHEPGRVNIKVYVTVLKTATND